MKISTLIASVFTLSFSSLFAANIISSSAPRLDGTTLDTFILNSSGDRLTSGFAGTGRFTISDIQVTALVGAGDYAALAAAFVPAIGSDNFVSGVNNALGASVAGVYYINAENFDETPLIGTTLYTFIGNSGTLSGSNQFGLVRHPELLVADPAAPGLPLSYTLEISDSVVLIGNTTTTNVTDPALGISNATVPALRLVAIPEPSVALLGAIGALGLLRRRR